MLKPPRYYPSLNPVCTKAIYKGIKFAKFPLSGWHFTCRVAETPVPGAR